MISSAKPITVSQLNSYIKALFESDGNLFDLFVSGEISNFKKHYPTGHLYFSLKDEKSLIKAVMFAGNARNVPFNVADGMKVIVRGRVSCYEVSGQYQIYVNEIQPEGIGSVYLAFEQLKSKLLSEGLFDEAIKKPLPAYPQKIGVITSRTGAVIHDIKTVAARRYPLCEIVLYPVEVQGEKAVKGLVSGLRYLNALPDIDVIIIGRGGGSIEELWAFNKEEVIREVYASCVPVISAVGHETDVTICDFVADKRAPTPSAAAEMAVPDQENIKIMLKDYEKRVQSAAKFTLIQAQQSLDLLKSDMKKHSPINLINAKNSELLSLKDRLAKNFRLYLANQRCRYEVLQKGLNSCSREAVLKKGYALILQGDVNLKNINQFSEGQNVTILVSDGSLDCMINNIKKADNILYLEKR